MRRPFTRSLTALAVLAVSAGALTACAGAGGGDQPDQIVRSYFEAVNAGDAEKALSIARPDSAETELLTADVLAGAGGVDDVVVLEPATSPAPEGEEPTVATVNASYTVDGAKTEASFTFGRSEGKWVVTGTSGVYSVLSFPFGEAVPIVEVNGTAVEGTATGTYNTSSYQLFPGTYAVSIPEDNTFFSIDEESVSDGTVSFDPSDIVPTPALKADFEASMTAFLTGCFSAPAPTRALECPNWRNNSNGYDSDVVWELIELPAYTLAYNNSPDQNPLSIWSDDAQAGMMHLSYHHDDGLFPAEDESWDVDFSTAFVGQLIDGAFVFSPLAETIEEDERVDNL
jgi:hypothetical protein